MTGQEDISQLAHHFLRVAARDFNRPVEGFTPEAMAVLLRYRWPGNVRELMSVVRRAVVVGDGALIGTSALSAWRTVRPRRQVQPLRPNRVGAGTGCVARRAGTDR